jgi:hypothetical protein
MPTMSYGDRDVRICGVRVEPKVVEYEREHLSAHGGCEGETHIPSSVLEVDPRQRSHPLYDPLETLPELSLAMDPFS